MRREPPLIRRIGNAPTVIPPKPAGSEKLFGKYDELVRLLLGFLLTGIVGTYLSHRYTTQQADLSAAGKVFSEHSKLIGDRYFAQNQLTLALRNAKVDARSNKKTKIETQLNAYRTVLQEWNSARGFNREMLKLYFGDQVWNMERNIHYTFRAWGQALEGNLNGSGSLDFKCLEQKTDDLLVQVHSMRVEMAKAMQTGTVGGSRDQSPVEQSPLPDSFCLQTIRPNDAQPIIPPDAAR
jgi:hypothetical protein